MRSGLIFVFFLFVCSTLRSQHQDTVLLREAVVYGIPGEKFLKGSVVHALDSSVRQNVASSHLGEIIPIEFPVYFRNYGNGMASTIALRGTSAEHTAVLWNGIPINSFSLGQADFSNLPAGGSYDVKIHAGGGSARFGSGALGGTILLNSTDQALPLNFTQEVASFGSYYTSLQGAVNVRKWYLNMSGYWRQSENDFTILSTGGKQDHASYRLGGVQQQIRYQWNGAHQISVNYWYHNADREIQPTIGRQNSNEEQQDENHRLSIQYKNNSAYGAFSGTAGFVQDVIIYNNDRSTVNRWITSANHQFKLLQSINAEVGASWNHIIGKIHQYEGGEAVEDRYDVMASLQKDLGDLSVSVNVRQPYVSGYNAPFLPYVGVEYSVIEKTAHQVLLRANASKNYRAPTLNERYWRDAGDLHLQPETSFASEGGVRWQWKGLVFDNTYFYQDVDQWIQWVAQENGIYRPRNVKRVRINGFESRLRWEKKFHQLIIVPSVSYQFVKSIIREAPVDEAHTIGKQLMYTPRDIASAYLQIRYRKYALLTSLQFNGKRYADFTNDETYALDPFLLVNLSVGKTWVVDRHQFNILFSIRNAFEEDYRWYSGRAVPGRNYAVQISYQLKHKQNEN